MLTTRFGWPYSGMNPPNHRAIGIMRNNPLQLLDTVLLSRSNPDRLVTPSDVVGRSLTFDASWRRRRGVAMLGQPVIDVRACLLISRSIFTISYYILAAWYPRSGIIGGA